MWTRWPGPERWESQWWVTWHGSHFGVFFKGKKIFFMKLFLFIVNSTWEHALEEEKLHVLKPRPWDSICVTLDKSLYFSWTSVFQNLARWRWQPPVHRIVGGSNYNKSCHLLCVCSDAQATSKCFMWIISFKSSQNPIWGRPCEETVHWEVLYNWESLMNI